MPASHLRVLDGELGHAPLDEVLDARRAHHHGQRDRLLEFVCRGSVRLRGREVVLRSRAAAGHGGCGQQHQLLRLRIQHVFVAHSHELLHLTLTHSGAAVPACAVIAGPGVPPAG